MLVLRGPPSAPSAPAAAFESVERPDPGLARGNWEAPPSFFVVVAAFALLGGLAWIVLAYRARRASR